MKNYGITLIGGNYATLGRQKRKQRTAQHQKIKTIYIQLQTTNFNKEWLIMMALCFSSTQYEKTGQIPEFQF